MINFNKLPIYSCLSTCFIHKCFGALIIACVATITSVTGQEKVTGVVSTGTGTPLPGATIVVVAASTTATTVADGSFTINANGAIFWKSHLLVINQDKLKSRAKPRY